MKKILKIVVVALVCYIIYYAYLTYPKLDLISGFSAKSVASCHFIDNRSLDLIQKNDNDINLIDLAKNSIDDIEKTTSASVYGLKTRKAIYRFGLGATLINDDFDVSKPYETPKRTILNKNLSFPYGDLDPKDTVFKNINYTKLNAAVANIFDKKSEKAKRTRAVLIIYKDKIIAEKYADDFNKDSKLLGWSMTKSITATYFGILQNQQKINVESLAPIEEWQKDNRKNIKISDLLHMNSGLEWTEDYASICDATQMLFQAENMGTVQLQKPSKFKPNSHWNYSSGTTNLLSYILRNQFKTHQEYLDFWYSSLIDKIGMNSMIVETDMSGNFVGSSYGWAIARDWAKFGLLYLHKGNWNGEQLFDPTWVDFITTPTPTSNGDYGAHFWLNSGGYYKDAPRNLYSCNGYQGQRIFILPSQDLVIVRLGLKEDGAMDMNDFLKNILASFKK
jgi:CubicO group peptidase (beta-lactamase class C family)